MGLFDFFKRKAAPTPQTRELNKLFQAQIALLGQNMPVWDEDTKEKYIEHGYAGNPDLYSVVNFIVNKAVDVDFKLCEKNAKGEEIEIEHEVLERLNNPNPLTSRDQHMEAVYGNYLLTGNAFQYAIATENGANAGKPQEIYNMPAAYVEVIAGDKMQPVKGYMLRTVGWFGREQFSKEEVLHTKAGQYLWGVGQELYGQSPVQAAYKSIQASNSGYEAHKKSLDNMGPPGMIYDKGVDAVGGKVGLTEDQQSQLETKLRKMSGIKHANTIAVGTGDLGYLSFGVNPVDLAIMEMQEMNLIDVCNIYQIDSALFNVFGGRTYSNLLEARQRAYTDSILPLVNRILSDYNRWLLPKYPDLRGKRIYLKPRIEAIPELQKDKKEQVEWLSKAYWMTVNERRKVMEMEEVKQEEADMILVPSTLTPLDTVGMPATLPTGDYDAGAVS